MTAGSARGVRNNNPLNIVKNKNNKWQGLADDQSDERFCSFKNASWGFRAAAVILIKYYDSGLDTVTKIVHRWAPDFENNTAAYIADVCNRGGFTANQTLNLHDYSDLAPLIKAMCIHENGSFPYTIADLNAGLMKAGVMPPRKPLAKTNAVKASTVAVAATGVSAVAQVNDTINNAAPAIDLMQTVMQYGPPALGIVAIAAIGFVIWDIAQKRKQGL